MILIDVNVLVYAHREDAPDHERYLKWLGNAINGAEPYGLNDLILSGVLRILTHPRIFDPPTPLGEALRFVRQLRDQPNCVQVLPGPRHWDIFTGLCESSGARGNLIPDAFFAALALESGSEWITTDGDYGRFPRLRWRHPFEAK